jgi:hypothetical protein
MDVWLSLLIYQIAKTQVIEEDSFMHNYKDNHNGAQVITACLRKLQGVQRYRSARDLLIRQNNMASQAFIQTLTIALLFMAVSGTAEFVGNSAFHFLYVSQGTLKNF